MRRLTSLLALIGAAGLLAGCNSERMGVSLPRALIYENTVRPFKVERDRSAPGPIVIPANLKTVEVTAYQIDIGNPLPPGLDLGAPGIGQISVGWGDISFDRILAEGDFDRFVYADTRIQTILIFKRATVIAHGVPRGAEAATENPEQGPPEL